MRDRISKMKSLINQNILVRSHKIVKIIWYKHGVKLTKNGSMEIADVNCGMAAVNLPSKIWPRWIMISVSVCKWPRPIGSMAAMNNVTALG